MRIFFGLFTLLSALSSIFLLLLVITAGLSDKIYSTGSIVFLSAFLLGSLLFGFVAKKCWSKARGTAKSNQVDNTSSSNMKASTATEVAMPKSAPASIADTLSTLSSKPNKSEPNTPAEPEKIEIKKNDNLEYADYPIDLEHSEEKCDLFILEFQRYLIDYSNAGKAYEHLKQIVPMTTFDARAALFCECYYLKDLAKPEGLNALQGFDQNSINKAITWFEQQSEQAPQLLRQLAVFYHNGVGVSKDVSKALALLKEGITKGEWICTGLLGWIYQFEKNFQDLPLAFEYLNLGAEHGNTDAMYRLGRLYREQKQFRDLMQSIHWLNRAAELGDSSSMFELGEIYDFENEVKSLELAMNWYEKSAQAGDTDAMYNLAWGYRREKSYRNLSSAIQWLSQAAERGDISSMLELGKIYDFESEVKNIELAMNWYEKGAQASDLDAIYNLAWGYRNIKDYRNLNLAISWYTKAADLGDHKAMCSLADIYYFENEVKNLKIAIDWYKNGSQAGNVDAMVKLAWCYRNEKNYRDLNLAIQWYTKAADLGHKDAMFQLGKVYDFESEVNSLETSMKWYKKAAKEGSKEAMYNLALDYKNEKTCRDLNLAIQWFTKAITLDHVKALTQLGFIYRDEKNYRDLRMSIDYFTKAANKGEPDAMRQLAQIYNIEGSVTDLPLAIEWYKKSAQAGNTKSFDSLGHLYNYNASVRNLPLAIEWSIKAADKGIITAMKRLGYLYRDEAQYQDFKKSEQWFGKAADMDDIASMKALVWMYRYEKSMINQDLAYKWSLKAANLGCTQAMTNIAQIHLEKGIYYNIRESIKWFIQSIKDNEADALYAFAKERFGARLFNTEQARTLAKAAAQQGHILAINELHKSYAHSGDAEAERNECLETLKRASKQGYFLASYVLHMYYQLNNKSLSNRYEELSNTQDNKQSILAKDLWPQLQSATDPSSQNTHMLTNSPKPAKHVIDLDTQSLLKELDGFMGIESVRQEVESLAAMQKANKLRQQKGLAINSPRLNLIFAGNPGTGKTTVARKLGVIYQRLGLIANSNVVEVSNKDFFGNYAKGGWSEDNFKSVIEKARGGILFIDEAYQLLSRGELGQNIINLLLQTMENERDDLMVIAAGYPAEMKKFVESNVGLGSRFNKQILFEDFTPQELLQLFISNAEKRGSLLSAEAKELLSTYLQGVHTNKDQHFGNARFIENLLDSVQQQTDLRAVRTGEDIGKIQASDILAATNGNALDPSPLNKQGLDPEQELFEMIGLNAVKQSVQKLNARIVNNQRRQERGLEVQGSGSLHMVFSGNPGTGKTHVARLLAKILKQKGVISHDRMVEVSRQDLVAGFIGQTAAKTQKVIDQAMGGVLFIDEAYTLNKNDSENDFGKEAIEVLLKEMEDKRDEFVVIVAGYEKEMVDFLDSNEGLKRRFKQYLRFEDFSSLELVEILKSFVKRGGDHIEANFLTELPKIMENWRMNYGTNFGNAGTIRNLYEELVASRSLRLMDIENPSDEQLFTLESADWDDAIVAISPISNAS